VVSAEQLKSVEWLAPWEASGPGLEAELAREVGPHHVLYGCSAVSVARRADCDEVLFVLSNGPSKLAVVHLTWSGKREQDATYPQVELYSSLEEFLGKRMEPDHTEHEQG